MSLIVNTNIASLNAQKALAENRSSLNTAMERLSSGMRINSAADDSAGLSIANRMESQIRGLNQAVRNANDGISLVQASEGAMDEMTSMLQRMRELSVQAANGVLSSTDRTNLQSEVAELKSELDRVVSTTTFNGKKVLDGSFGENFQIGTNAGDTITVGIANMGTTSLGGLTGTASVSSITSASAKGVEAKVTETLLDFTANDDYTLTATFTVDSKEYSYVIDSKVEGGSAKNVVDELNAKLLKKPDALDGGTTANITAAAISNTDLSSIIEVSYVGRQVTLKNLQGGDIVIDSGKTLATTGSEISVSGDISKGGGQVFVTAMAGASSGSTSGLLGDSRFNKTSLINSNTTAKSDAAAAVTTATPGTAAITFATAENITSADTFTVEIDGTAITVDMTGTAGTAANIATAVKQAVSAQGITGVTATVTGQTVTISKASGADMTVAITSASAGSHGAITIADTGATAATLTLGTANAVTISGGTPVSAATSGTPGGVMYLDLMNQDTYTFTFADDASTPATITSVEATYDGTASSLEAFANAIKAGLQNAASGYSFTASVSEGRIKIVESNGKAFRLSNYASEGAGRVVASVESGQGTGGVESVLLDDVSVGTSFKTKGAGVAKATDIDLSVFGHTDTISFSISDGTATARVSATQGVTSTTVTATTMKNAVTVALAQAGLDDVMSVSVGSARTAGNAAGDYTLTLVHKLGYEVTIGDFDSASSGQMLVKSGSTDTTGHAAYLNDDLSGTSPDQVVSGIDVSTTNGANEAIDVIDRAIADIDNQRGSLGAVQNRLQHTVNNLNNISVNTASAQSRIQDADYAVEAASLAKAQIMQQAATAMLAQANASQQTVLSLLS